MKILAKAISLFNRNEFENALKCFETASSIYGMEIVKHNITLCRKEINDKKNTKPQDAISPAMAEKEIAVMQYIENSALDFFRAYPAMTEQNLSPPLVSIIMTTHNSAETVEKSILSLLFQSWPNIEIIVTDDNSSDKTVEILRELKKRSNNTIKIIELNSNLGTYLAKNIAVQAAKGEIIMFQDSDDYSHPDRVSIQASALIKNSNTVGNRTKYCRFDPATGNITSVGGHVSKFGLITLAVRRFVFQELGYFDAVRRAGDEEWFERVKSLYGTKSVENIPVTAYAAEFRNESLAADLMSIGDDGSIRQVISGDRQDYVRIFKKRLENKQLDKNWFKKSFPALPKRPLEGYPESVAALKPDNELVYISLCSIPQREKNLHEVIKRLLPQADHIYVYLDKYNKIPSFLLHESITVKLSKNYKTDFRDNAKFLPYNDIKASGKDFYFLTCDDDLLYPLDYVATIKGNLKNFENKIIAGVHGVVYEEEPKGYFNRRFTYHFKNSGLSNPKLVNNLGTGTVGFHSSSFASIDPHAWPIGGMVDIFFSIEAKNSHIPMLCIARKPGWLSEQASANEGPTLYQEFQDKDKLIAKELINSSPWGYKSILNTINMNPSLTTNKLRTLLPFLAQNLSVEHSLFRMRG